MKLANRCSGDKWQLNWLACWLSNVGSMILTMTECWTCSSAPRRANLCLSMHLASSLIITRLVIDAVGQSSLLLACLAYHCRSAWLSLSLSLSLSVVTVPAVTIAQLCSTDQLVIWVLTIHDSVMYPDKHRMRRPLVATVWTDCVASSAFTNRVWTDLSSEFECVWFHWIGLFQFWLLNRAVELVTSESVTVSQFSTPVLGCTGPHVWLVDSNCS